MFAPLRAWQLTGTFLALVLACDSKKEPSVSEALAQSDKKAQDEKAAKAAEDQKLAEAAKKAKAGVLEHPWTFDEVKAGLPIGTALAYAMSGTNAKGKPVSDRMLAEVKGSSDTDVKVLFFKESQKGDAAVTQPQGYAWDKLSPYFHVERSEAKILRPETVQVPAGSFDCVVADVTGFFGNNYTVWMIVDKPGVYAKVVEHPLVICGALRVGLGCGGRRNGCDEAGGRQAGRQADHLRSASFAQRHRLYGRADLGDWADSPSGSQDHGR